MSRINLRSVPAVIKVFGGNQAILAFTESTYRQSVSNWRRFGQFPARYHHKMTGWLDRRGYTASPALWGQDEEGPMRKRPKRKTPPSRKSAARGRASVKGGKNGNGKAKVRKRPAAVVGPVDQHAQATVGDLDGGRTL